MLLVSFVLLYLIGSAFAVQDITHFAGRSGDIIVQPQNAVADDSAILLHGEYFANTELKSIEDVRVADLFAHVMGTQPFNVYANRQGFPKGDLFNKPKAAFVVTLDSVAPGLYAKYSAGKPSQTVGITSNAYPANTYTVASNIATGAHASVHGIVGKAWQMPNGDIVEAHQTEEGSSLAANMADILAQEWKGESLVVSASASTPFAVTFATHQQLEGEDAFGLSLQDGAFVSIYTKANSFELSKQALQAIFNDAAFSSFLGATIKRDNNKLTVTVGSRSASFDLSAEADFSLFAELGFVYNLINKLEADSDLSALVSDSTPDYYSIVFSSLKDIQAKYGENSEAIVALVLVDSAVQQAIVKFDKLYDNRVASAVVCLNTHTAVSDSVKEAVYKVAQNYVKDRAQYDAHFPSLYLEGGNAQQACSNIKAAVDANTQVHCFKFDYNWVLDNSSSSDDGNSTNPKPPLNVHAFWIFFFLTIALILTILTGIYGLCVAGMDASKDSLLFRSAGRSHHH